MRRIGGKWRARAAIAVPVATSVAVCAARIGRPFGYDESVTVGAFVTAPRFIDAVTSQVVANNHQLVSGVSWLERSAGVDSEAGLRLLPLLCIAATTALVSAALLRRHGPAVALLGGLLLATSPLAVMNGRDLRGYAPLLLAATASTLVMLAARGHPAGRSWHPSVFVVIAVLGMSAQLYMTFVLVVQATYALSDPNLRARRWWRWCAIGGLLGVAIQVALLVGILDAGRGRTFRPGFPLDLATALSGESLVASLGTAALLVAWLRDGLRSKAIRNASAVVLALTAAAWVVAPTDLYTRFFLWLCPAVAVVCALGAQRLPGLWPRSPTFLGWAIGALVVSAQLAALVPALAEPGLPNREAARILAGVEAAGGSPCVVVTSAESLSGYTKPRPIATPAETSGCSVVLSLVPALDAPIIPALDAMFPSSVTVGRPGHQARLYTDASPTCVVEKPPAGCWDG